MEKLLTMSFISNPTDFSIPAWIRARMPSAGRPITINPSMAAAEDSKNGTCGPAAAQCSTGRNTRATAPHLALEFDGLNCFETFVIH